MAKDHRTGDGSRIAPLGEVDDFEVAEGYPDVRGWRVDAADGTEVGKVHELLVDLDALRTRYLDVRLTDEVAGTSEDRDVLIPIGAARVDDDHDVVTVSLTAERVGLLPVYTHAPLTREQEYEVRRHFTIGRAAAAGAAGVAGAAAGAAAAGASDAANASRESRDFYDDEAFDDRHFFSSRDSASTNRNSTAPDHRDVDGETEVRVPLKAEDSVVVKRGEDGRDEIIIRRPRSDERTDDRSAS